MINRPTLPANNYAELVKWIGANKGKINLANAGLGCLHLCGLLFQGSIKVEMTTVLQGNRTGDDRPDRRPGRPYVRQTTNTSGQIETGKVKAYAVTTQKRLTTPALKNLPTLDEVGVKAFDVSVWHGLYAPKGTPKAVTDSSTPPSAQLKDRLHQARGSAGAPKYHQ